jgi:GDP-L-fucose synthase
MRIYLAGHRGMVGSAILRNLERRAAAGEDIEVIVRSRSELDLTEQAPVRDFMNSVKPDCVILAAAKVGGIHANNSYPGEFIYQNLMIQNNVIHSAASAAVTKLLFLGSSCIYPRLAEQPMSEDLLLTGNLESTNEPYAISKIAGIKMCESYNRQYGLDYRSVMPTNLYGPRDNFHPENSHVVPGLLRRFHEAKISNVPEIVVWGTGLPYREFLHVDDMAAASLFVLNLDKSIYLANSKPMLSHINVGSGSEVRIRDLAMLIASVVGYQGNIVFDTSKNDGTPRKLMDSGRINNMGWHHSVSLEDGLKETYSWYVNSLNECVGEL